MHLSTPLLILALVGIGTCGRSAVGRFQHWQELNSQLQEEPSMADPPSQMQDDEPSVADPPSQIQDNEPSMADPPSQLQEVPSMADSTSLALASATNGSTHQVIMQELGMSFSEIQGYGCQFSAGTYGGSGGGSFNDHQCSGVVSRIVIRSGRLIDSIQVTFKLPNGHYYHGGYRGGRGGGLHDIRINVNQGERIIGILGKTGSLVDQLGFYTNHGRIFGPYGGSGGGRFTVSNCDLKGIFGRAGSLIDSIGFFCRRVK